MQDEEAMRGRFSLAGCGTVSPHPPAVPPPCPPHTTQEWHALVCNSDFFFNDVQNESVAEQLRERVRFFKETGREIDFYIVPEPVFLDKKFPDVAKQVKRPCVALVSSDKTWTT